MPDLFRDAIWQFVGAILGLIAIIVTVVLFFAQRRRKNLTYEIVSQSSVISTADEITGKIQIIFQGEPVSKVHLLVLRLANNGNIPITSGDYEREVSFKFSDDVHVLTAEVSETTPENLNAEVSIISGKSINLKPILLNSGDTITIKSLVSNFDDKINIDGRVVGVNSIEKRVDNTTWGSVLLITGMLLSISIIILNIKAFNSPTFPVDNPLAFIGFGLGYVLMIIGMLSNRRYKKVLAIFYDYLKKVTK